MRDQCLNMVTILHPLTASASASAAVTTAAAAAAAASTSAWPLDAVRRLSGKTLSMRRAEFSSNIVVVPAHVFLLRAFFA